MLRMRNGSEKSKKNQNKFCDQKIKKKIIPFII